MRQCACLETLYPFLPEANSLHAFDRWTVPFEGRMTDLAHAEQDGHEESTQGTLETRGSGWEHRRKTTTEEGVRDARGNTATYEMRKRS